MNLGGQKGSALVETVILLPIYILIFLGIIFLGESLLIKQKIDVAERYGAWMKGINPSPFTSNQMKALFFSGFKGKVTLGPTVRYKIDFTQGNRNSILQNYYPDSAPLAGDVLNNFDESWMTRYKAKIEYTYSPSGY